MKVSNFTQYVGVSIVFWLLTFGVFDGGTSSIEVEPIALIVNVVLLPALWRGSEVARVVLVIQAGLIAASVVVHAVVVAWVPFTAVSLLAACQLFFLWRMGRQAGGAVGQQVASVSQ